MKRLAWCSLVAGFATLYQCGGSGNVGIGNPDGGATNGSAGDTGAASSSGAGGKDGSAAADGSSGGSKEGGASEGGSSGGEGGAVEGGGGEGGSAEGGTGEGGAGADGGDGGGVIEGGTDASDGGIVAMAHFRVAQLIPTVAAYDFCWQQSGGAWNGPVMLGFGISARLAYEQVSEYVAIPVASTTVRIVAAAATDCTTSFADVTLGPASSADSYLVAAFVQGNAARQVTAFVDEGAANGTNNDRIRLIDAAFTSAGGSGGGAASIDLYVGGTASTASLFDDVPFGGVAPPTLSVDPNGYLSHDAFKAADIRVRLHAGLDLLDEAAFTTTAAHVYSFFTVGVHDVLPANTTPMRLLVCDDTAAPVGHLGVCSAGGTQL